MDNIFADDYFEVAEESLLKVIEDYKAKKEMDKAARDKRAKEWTEYRRRIYDRCSRDPKLRKMIDNLCKLQYEYDDGEFSDRVEARYVEQIRNQGNDIIDILYSEIKRPDWVDRDAIAKFVYYELINTYSIN